MVSELSDQQVEKLIQEEINKKPQKWSVQVSETLELNLTNLLNLKSPKSS